MISVSYHPFPEHLQPVAKHNGARGRNISQSGCAKLQTTRFHSLQAVHTVQLNGCSFSDKSLKQLCFCRVRLSLDSMLAKCIVALHYLRAKNAQSPTRKIWTWKGYEGVIWEDGEAGCFLTICFIFDRKKLLIWFECHFLRLSLDLLMRAREQGVYHWPQYATPYYSCPAFSSMELCLWFLPMGTVA